MWLDRLLWVKKVVLYRFKIGSEIIGTRTRARVIKNKVAPPFETAEFDIMYNEGISRIDDILDLATELEIVDKRGSYYSYGDLRLAQGRVKAKEFLRENPGLVNEIEYAIRNLIFVDNAVGEPKITIRDGDLDDELRSIVKSRQDNKLV